MNYLFEKVGNHHKEYPAGNDPEVAARMLPLRKYLELARRIIGKFAPVNCKKHMLASEDAISFVASRIMRGDWNYNKDKGMKLTTYRGMCGRYAITEYLDRLGHQKKMVSIDQEHGDGLAIKDILFDEDSIADEREEGPGEAKKRRYISNLLNLLTPMERECVEMRFWWGLDAKQTAKALGVHRQAVQYALTRAMDTLRRSAGVLNVQT